MPTLNEYLVLSAILFSIGTAGVFVRRNLITILLSIEIMLNAVNLSFVAFGRSLGTGMKEFKDSVTGNSKHDDPPELPPPTSVETTTNSPREHETV